MMSVAFEDAITRGVLDVARQRGRQASRPFRTGGVVALSSRWKEDVDSPSLEATAASRCPRMRSCLDAFSENVGAPSLGARVLRRSYPSRSGRRTGASSSTSPTTTSIPRRSNHLSGRVPCRVGHVPAITQRQEDATLKSGSRLMRNPRWRRSGRQRNRFAVATPPTPHHARLPSAQIWGPADNQKTSTLSASMVREPNSSIVLRAAPSRRSPSARARASMHVPQTSTRPPLRITFLSIRSTL